ncbi:hypothetical protein PhaeoP83_00720 [Phaeobacter inhibens]|uniref:SEC-C motif-containing protein n=1 Tax=Phaeobacter inhibens TaxID=221822 RepID=A0A2I7LVG4_9RHOB|nr:hypothetical protein [Phaeobacter inhibens]AUQ49028.1 hypothetical protein PhaeoP83_00720 [Phaeobacter inhibens]AUQ93528.1 hypothetical protein PhaeoP66_00713 [Phaeobacter inhibens]AUQ99992.1 hypothetical protein PhaeoP88_02649 [Phaeobacter inhibens]AUR18831.1 hypothetical protein PhaeoP80_00720 [Phaeobacter inhibens]
MTNDELADELIRKIGGDLDCPEATWWASVEEEANAVRKAAVSMAAEETADRAWFLMTVCRARGLMASAYGDIMKLRYRTAWIALEQAELACADLKNNPLMMPEEFEIVELQESVERWQRLFPYRWFFSPEMIIKEERCSICKVVRSPFSTCSHRLGRVYCGQMCSAEVVDFKFLGVSLVTDPVQKFSVAIPDPDPFDYGPVRFVADRLAGPFDGWTSSTRLAYHDHAQFNQWPPDGVCPCKSGRYYRDCCLPLPGVLLPRTSIVLDNSLPESLVSNMVVVLPPPDAE